MTDGIMNLKDIQTEFFYFHKINIMYTLSRVYYEQEALLLQFWIFTSWPNFTSPILRLDVKWASRCMQHNFQKHAKWRSTYNLLWTSIITANRRHPWIVSRTDVIHSKQVSPPGVAFFNGHSAVRRRLNSEIFFPTIPKSVCWRSFAIDWIFSFAPLPLSN